MVRAEEEKEGPWHSTHRMKMAKRTLWLVDRARQPFSLRVHFAKLGNGNSAQIPFRVRAPRAPRSPIRIPSLYTVHPLLLNPRGISTLSSIRKDFSIPFSRAKGPGSREGIERYIAEDEFSCMSLATRQKWGLGAALRKRETEGFSDRENSLGLGGRGKRAIRIFHPEFT